MSSASSFNDPAGRELLAMLRTARRNKFGDPKYHSGRKKKEFASPYLEFLDKLEKAARKTPQPYEFDPGHADGIRHADLDAGVRVLNEVIYECGPKSFASSGSASVAQRRMVGRDAVFKRGHWLRVAGGPETTKISARVTLVLTQEVRRKRNGHRRGAVRDCAGTRGKFQEASRHTAADIDDSQARWVSVQKMQVYSGDIRHVDEISRD